MQVLLQVLAATMLLQHGSLSLSTRMHACMLAPVQVVQRCLAAGKCVVHEKPVAGTVEAALSVLRPYRAAAGPQPLWLVAENYRYEGVFLEASKVGGWTLTHASCMDACSQRQKLCSFRHVFRHVVAMTLRAFAYVAVLNISS